MELVFILVAPAVPENIGASCRALKTMGFSQLRLVATDAHLHKQAHVLAHGSVDILQDAQVFERLEQALEDIDWAVATSAKSRHQWRTLTPADQLATLILAKQASVNRVAIVFGCEESGLSNEQLLLCDHVSNIALPVAYPSLNLSQAVMLYAYELRILAAQAVQVQRPASAAIDHNESQYHALKQKARDALTDLGFTPDSKLARWVLESLPLSDAKAIGFLHALCDKVLSSK